jgi:hypothetical protein
MACIRSCYQMLYFIPMLRRLCAPSHVGGNTHCGGHICPLLPTPPPAQAQVSVQDLPDGCTSSPAFRSHSWFGPWVDVPIEDVKTGVRQPEVEVRSAFAHCITEWSVLLALAFSASWTSMVS